MNEELDAIKINFDEGGLFILNIILAIIMFGVALGITTEDFKLLFKSPKILITGIVSQFILFPAFTFLLVKILEPTPSIALGMFLVVACPGGNISNFITQLAKGNAALSVSLTAFATLVSIIMTPLNFQFWSGLYQPTSLILESVKLNPTELIKIVVLVLGIPLILGMAFRKWKPSLAKKIMKILKPLSFLIFIAFIIIAISQNTAVYLKYLSYVIYIVILHNILGFILGYFFAKFMKLSPKNQKTIAIETGIQNSGLGIALIFTFFNGLGGMLLIVATWGIWHIISGLLLATYWSKKDSSKTIKV